MTICCAQHSALTEALPLQCRPHTQLSVRQLPNLVIHSLQPCSHRVQAQLSTLDDQFQSKLLAEADKYEELLREKEALNESWDEQNRQLLVQHEQLLEEVTADFTAKQQASHWPENCIPSDHAMP